MTFEKQKLTALEALAYSIGGEDKPHKAQVILSHARSRDVGGLLNYFKYLIGGGNE